MLHDGRQRDREGPRQLADGDALLFVEAGQKRPARRIGEGCEGAVEDGALIVNHGVYYWALAPTESRHTVRAS